MALCLDSSQLPNSWKAEFLSICACLILPDSSVEFGLRKVPDVPAGSTLLESLAFTAHLPRHVSRKH